MPDSMTPKRYRDPALRERLAWFGEKSGEKSGQQLRANPDLDGCDLKLVQLA